MSETEKKEKDPLSKLGTWIIAATGHGEARAHVCADW